ncbi:MAG: hypothetical protein Q9166_005033 [cf. Caloplaca sp. 2 TL-2023]
MPPKSSSSRRSASPPVSSRTRASPSKDGSAVQHDDPKRRSGSAPISTQARAARPKDISASTEPSKSASKAPPTLPAPPASSNLRRNSPAGPKVSTPLPPLNKFTVLRLSQAIRTQYEWNLPLDVGCKQLIPDLPIGLGKALTIDNKDGYDLALQQGYLTHIGFLKVVFTTVDQRYDLHSNGKPYPYRGQGPIWDQNSCHLDVCLVAARLLNVGATTADKGNMLREQWLQSLDAVQQKFLSLISASWESMTAQANSSLRHHFWDRDLAKIEGVSKRPDFGSAVNVWNTCIPRIAQFSFQMSEGLSPCKQCGAPPPKEKTIKHQQHLPLDMAKAQLDEHKTRFQAQPTKPIGFWIDRELKITHKNCGRCGTPNGRLREREIVGKLPHRLVVAPGECVQPLISAATNDNVRFPYHSQNGKQDATYRWLGGIYFHKKHFRLYWTDASIRHVRVYDGREACGAIVGGIVAANLDEKVPRPWSQTPVLLFYERINKAGLEFAANTIKSQIGSALHKALLNEAKGAYRADDTKSDEPANEETPDANHGDGSHDPASEGSKSKGEGDKKGDGGSHDIPGRDDKLKDEDDKGDGDDEGDKEEEEEQDEQGTKDEGDSSDDDTDKPDGNADHRGNDDNKDGANGDDTPKGRPGNEEQGAESPLDSPLSSPPESPSTSPPATPPSQTRNSGLLASIFGLLTPPFTPARKPITSPSISLRRSPRTIKPRSSTRTAQMIPPNTRTAGSMGPYKPRPAANVAGSRGRSTIRMSSVTVGQKRSSSASSVSSTGSSVGGRGGGAVKRVRFAAIRG